MGSGGSVSAPVNQEKAKELAGDAFTEEKFKELATIPIEKWNELVKEQENKGDAKVEKKEKGGYDKGAASDDVLSESSWATEYCLFGVLSSKDDKKVMELYKADGKLQVTEEKGAPRLSYLGLPTGTKGCIDEGSFAAFEAPCKPPSKRVYWLASFVDKEHYHGEHKERPSNQAFVPHYMATWVGSPDGGFKMPEQKAEMFAVAVTALDGHHMGPYWHLEKPSKSVDADKIVVILAYMKAKDAAQALELISLLKAHCVTQLNSEPGALRCSILPPHKVGVEGVGASDMPGGLPSDDEVTVTLMQSFESVYAYYSHKASDHAKALDVKLKAQFDLQIGVLEFEEAVHLAKPK